MNALIFVCLSIAGIASALPAYTPYNNVHLTPVHTPVRSTYHPVPVHHGQTEGILRQTNDIQEDGHYQWEYETDTGILAHESGLAGQSVEGAARWVAPDGTPIEFSYTADENGYHPVGNAIPVAPPVPEAIARALVWIQQHPYDEAAANARSLGRATPVHHTIVPVKPVYKPVQPTYRQTAFPAQRRF